MTTTEVGGTERGYDGALMEMAFGSYHVGDAQFTLAEGSIHFISENVDLNLYRSLATRGGGEIVGAF